MFAIDTISFGECEAAYNSQQFETNFLSISAQTKKISALVS